MKETHFDGNETEKERPINPVVWVSTSHKDGRTYEKTHENFQISDPRWVKANA